MSEQKLFDEPITMQLSKEKKPRKPLSEEQLERRKEALKKGREKAQLNRETKKLEKEQLIKNEKAQLKETIKKQRAPQPIKAPEPIKENNDMSELRKQLAELTKLTMELKDKKHAEIMKPVEQPKQKPVEQPKPTMQSKPIVYVEPIKPVEKPKQYKKIISTSRNNKGITYELMV